MIITKQLNYNREMLIELEVLIKKKPKGNCKKKEL